MTDAERRAKKRIYMRGYIKRRRRGPDGAAFVAREREKKRRWARTPRGRQVTRETHRRWRERNREHYNAYFRAYRARRRKQQKA